MLLFTYIKILTFIVFCFENNILYIDVCMNKISFADVLYKINYLSKPNNDESLLISYINQSMYKTLGETFMINILAQISDLFMKKKISFRKFTVEGLENRYILFTYNKPFMLMNNRDSYCYFISVTLEPSVNIEFIKNFGTFDIDIYIMNNVPYYWNNTERKYDQFSFEELQGCDWYNSLMQLTPNETSTVNGFFIIPLMNSLPKLLNYTNFLLSNRMLIN